MNASVAPESGNESIKPQKPIGSVDINAAALAPAEINTLDRSIAGISYFGPFGIFVALTRPEKRFIIRHVHAALLLYIVRTLWLIGILTGWWLRAEPVPGESKLREYSLDIIFTVIIGFPVSDTWRSGALPWLITPVILTLLATFVGSALAVAGKTADFRAFVSADWSDPVPNRSFLGGMSPEEERELARRARERQIERLRMSSQLLRTEETRRTRMSEIQAQIERVNLQREYNDQLLALGEISHRRYEQISADLDSEDASLRTQLSNLETRILNADYSKSDADGNQRLKRPEETYLESLAVVTPDGIPIFTYGQFQLDDAIVAGMLSAFDSLSEEVFGSRVRKTALDEGQVLFFAHGDYVLVMASFVDEPAPRQIEDLRTMLQQFESANAGPLARKQYDPRYLHEVVIPFRFVDRLRRPL